MHFTMDFQDFRGFQKKIAQTFQAEMSRISELLKKKFPNFPEGDAHDFEIFMHYDIDQCSYVPKTTTLLMQSARVMNLVSF